MDATGNEQGGLLIPPINFGMVEENLYRSGMPNELNFPFLERLNLRKIIYLAPEDLTQQFLNFVDDQGIELLPLSWEGNKSPWKPVSEEVVLTALDYILDANSNYPLYIMCNLGRHRTGTIVGCLRKLQRWNLTAVFEEYRRFAGPKVRLLNEQFIELFDTDLVRVPQNPPEWL
ncbi:putative tyrosine-protein phosphatase [Porphyridium purpureum]|uniref:protein-tyrosine-phosphatase n=1 Tax=Porphyridium purpureum TaxID=35688 RepID=A0A5J4YWC4_PORPP|nr:putative tyrosine-protein phosphatase [Porphyridium purpureum]|eukprot:POR3173..scf227_4